jgi:Uncharacterized protein conserved in bacteria
MNVQEKNVFSKNKVFMPAQIRSVVKIACTAIIGCMIFFVPFTVNGENTILIDHISTWVKRLIGNQLLMLYISCMAIAGSVLSIRNKEWCKGLTSKIIMLFKFFGTVLTIILCLGIGPEWLQSEGLGDWLIFKLLASVTIIVPLGGTFLALLTDFGFLELVGGFIQPVMYRLFRTSGRSAICIVSSFVGSFSVGLLMTNKLYCERKFTYKEAVIIATGFSTISASFMVVIAKTLDLMEYWLLYFCVSFIVTCIVSMISIRIWPIRSLPNSLYKSTKISELGKKLKKRSLAQVCKEAKESAFSVADSSPTVRSSLKVSLINSLDMGATITPTVIGGAFVGIILSTYTSLFDYIGYIFYPFFRLFRVPEALAAGKAVALSISESMVPTVAVTDGPFQTRFIIGIACVSIILFIAGTIPCILATKIKISIPKLMIIWFERVVFSIIVSSIAYYVLAFTGVFH